MKNGSDNEEEEEKKKEKKDADETKETQNWSLTWIFIQHLGFFRFYNFSKI